MTTNRPSMLGRANKVAIALTFAAGLAAAGGTGAAAVTSAPATAATVTAHDSHSDAEHAEQDLVGRSITDIERQPRAAAAKVKDATGTAPGGHVRTQTVPNSGLSSAAAVDPGVGGAWSAVIPADVVPIFQAVLPNGKVLMW